MPRDEQKKGADEKIALLRIDSLTRVCLLLIRTAGYCFCAYMLFRIVEAAAGKKTIAELTMNLLANVTVNKWVAYALAALGCGYGAYERRVRQNAIKRFAPLVKQKELKLDPRRSSSGLTEDGRTRKDDE